YHLPTPRVEAGLRLRGLATAAADVSDGLVQDLGHICAASGVGARLRADRVPLSTAARLAVAADRSLAAVALAGGDDYELVFTVPRARSAEVESVAAGLDLPLTEIGEIVAGAGIEVVDADGRPVELTAGWRHF
ncbi:MAG: thiamine-phosphate kinase, partial [Inquilinus sp.]|nr:thiamine-phosphate kinase [Inquilinus sp.]